MTRGSVVVPASLAGERLDRALALLTGLPRGDVQRAIEAGAVSIAGSAVQQRSRRLKEGELVEVDVELEAARRPSPPSTEAVEFEILYSDSDLVVVNKPAGVVTHPGAGARRPTLAGGLLARFPDLASLPAAGYGSPERPGIVHRLDRETSGLLVVARSPRAYESLTRQLKARTAKRTYLALALGRFQSPEGVVDAPIGRSTRHPTRMAVADAGREARTYYRVLRSFSRPLPASELELRLDTGRTHQIRVHLAAIGHPVLGDTRYGGARRSSGVKRLMLHAYRLGFLSPASGVAMEFEVPPPEDYLDAIARFS